MRVCDTREPSELKNPLARSGWTLKALDAGDYAFESGDGCVVLVERKTVSQFLTDMQSGQLSKQARGLVEASPHPILLLEGPWAQDRDGALLGTRITWEQAWNQLATLQDLGLRLQLSTHLEHTLTRLGELVEYYSKGVHESARRGLAEDAYLATVCLVPGVGKRTAAALKARYRTLAEVAQATADDFMLTVEGVGPVLAQRLYQFWRT